MTLHHFKNAASKRLPFHATLWLVGEQLARSYFSLTKLPPTVTDVSTPSKNRASRQNSHIRQANYIHRFIQGVTPQKGGEPKNRIDTIRAARKMRNEACDGLCIAQMLKEDGSDKRLKCCRCKKLTQAFCTGCKRALCFAQKRPKGDDTEDTYEMSQFVHQKGNEQEWVKSHYIRSCYHIAHEKKWDAIWEKRRIEPTALDLVTKRQKLD